MKTGIEFISEERQRQLNEEGYSSNHDASYVDGELADAASCYAMTDDTRSFIDRHWGDDQWLNLWPFDLEQLKLTPRNRIKQLTKAGALIAAEIDRLQTIK